jgi:hypothetical protein
MAESLMDRTLQKIRVCGNYAVCCVTPPYLIHNILADRPYLTI